MYLEYLIKQNKKSIKILGEKTNKNLQFELFDEHHEKIHDN
jgi:hypothetical protein